MLASLEYLGERFTPARVAAHPRWGEQQGEGAGEEETLATLREMEVLEAPGAPVVVIDPTTGHNAARNAFCFRDVQAAFREAHR